jgi:hypothetical protein
LEEKLVYKLKVFLGYTRTRDPKGIQTYFKKRIKRIKGVYEGRRGRCAT